MASPIVLSKGYDEVAQKIKVIAAEHNIPMVENITLARALTRAAQIGQGSSRDQWLQSSNPGHASWALPLIEINRRRWGYPNIRAKTENRGTAGIT